MQDKIKVEILDLTVDSDEEEEKFKPEPLTPVKEKIDESYDSGESSGLQKSPSGRYIRNIDKCLDKAIADIKKGQSLATVAFQHGIPQDVLYNKLVSRSLPRETEILTAAEENSLVKWIVKANQNNSLIFKNQLMEKVGKLKKVLNITPIFAKSKFGRMWYDYFMKKHPEIFENDGLLMPCDKVQNNLSKKPISTPDPEDLGILTPDEEKSLVSWIITSNKNNTLVFKYQLMRRVGKLNKVAKSTPGFTKSKFGRLWYENFLKNHPEIYENDELLLPSDNLPGEKSTQWPDEADIKLAQSTFQTQRIPATKDSTTLLLSYNIKDAIVVLRDFRKEKDSPYRLIEENVVVQQESENYVGNQYKKESNQISESASEDFESFKVEPSLELFYESGIESDQYSSHNEDDVPYKPYTKFKKRNIKNKTSKPVCSKCAKSFCNFEKLKRHMSTIHQPELHQVVCLDCNKKYASKYHLSLHMRGVHGVERLQHKCNECGKHFKFQSSMRKHQRTVHEGQENTVNLYFCDICEKGFKYKNSLEAHIIYGHLKEKKQFSCNICKMSFIKRSLMLRHKTRHSKIKPMECTHCGKTYSRKYLLREHIKYCVKAVKGEISKNCVEDLEDIVVD